MEIIFEKISVPQEHSFIARRMDLSDTKFKIHSHNNYELNLIISGSGRRIVGNNISTFRPGDLVLLGPNLSHSWEILDTEDGVPASCITTHFDENIISSTFFNIPELQTVKETLNQAQSGLLFKDNIENIQSALELLVDSQGLEKYIQLLKVFNLLINVKNKESLSLETSLNVKFEKDLKKLNKVYEYVFNNIIEGIDLNNISSHMGMAPTSFCRFFKKKTDKPFMQYVKDVRISIATKMLVETDKSITEICYDSGYNNLANFNHYFKQTMGKTPSAYRKSFLKDMAEKDNEE